MSQNIFPPALQGQTVLVVGGTSGIGLSAAIQAQAAGATVIVTGQDADRSATVAAQYGFDYRAFDVTRAEQIEPALAGIAHVDHLVLMAGSFVAGKTLEADVPYLRRAFDERLSAEAARSRRYGHPFGVIILDLDHFKQVNDRFGHPAGDEVLKFVAKTVDANVRETDLAARIGGEEFAVILPESVIEDVRAVAEKLREAVGEGMIKPVEAPDGIRITLSAGAACSAGHLVTPESIVAAADAALFRSKNEGRNRVTIAPPSAGRTQVQMHRVTEQKGE